MFFIDGIYPNNGIFAVLFQLMNAQQAIFEKVFKDTADRTILARTHFGDLIFKENHKESELYKALQIYVSGNTYNESNPFEFVVHTIGSTQSEYDNFIKQGSFFIEPHLPELHKKLFYRDDFYEKLSKANPKSNYEVYIADIDYKSSMNLEEIEKTTFDEFCKLVLANGNF